MTTPTSQRAQAASENKVAKLFGLTGENWMRHANPWSVWTRFAVPPLLAISIWSRDWIGWWSPRPRRALPDLHGGQPAAVPPTEVDEELGIQGSLGRADLV